MNAVTLRAFADELTKIAGFNRGFSKPLAAVAQSVSGSGRKMLSASGNAGTKAVRGKPVTGSTFGGVGKRGVTGAKADLNPLVPKAVA